VTFRFLALGVVVSLFLLVFSYFGVFLLAPSSRVTRARKIGSAIRAELIASVEKSKRAFSRTNVVSDEAAVGTASAVPGEPERLVLRRTHRAKPTLLRRHAQLRRSSD
jgi:hypothetical protein